MYSRSLFNNILISCLFIFVSVTGYTQVRPLDPPLGNYLLLNYTRSYSPITPIRDMSGLAKPANQWAIKTTTTYTDGLGRAYQSVQKQATPASKDIVTITTFDEFGREQFHYLPFSSMVVAEGDITNNGLIKYNAYQQQQAFSANYYPGENYYYGITLFDNSPLIKERKKFAPGSSWAGSAGTSTEKYSESAEGANTTTDEVYIWNIEETAGSVPVKAGSYTSGRLTKETSTDEQGRKTIEFKNHFEQVVLQKTQLDDNPAGPYTGWICTYYVYDDFGQLRFIMQPGAVEWLTANNWSFAAAGGATVANELCFRNEYDQFRRNIIRKIPGAEEVFLVYDDKDRLVFVQDANLRAKNEWMTTLYDARDRAVISGLIKFYGTHTELQNLVTQSTSILTDAGTSLPDDLVLNQATAGQTEWYARSSISLESEFEVTASFAVPNGYLFSIIPRAGFEPVIEIDQAEVNRYPVPSGSQLTIHNVNYYDKYDWLTQTGNLFSKTIDPAVTGNSSYFISEHYQFPANAEPVFSGINSAVAPRAGLLTGSKTYILNNSFSTPLYVVNFYNRKDRLVQVQKTNITGGRDVAISQYDFSGKIIRVLQTHEKKGTNPQSHTILTKSGYDRSERLIDVKKFIISTVNNQTVTSPEKTVFTQQYNELGRVYSKTIGNNLTTIDYDYNIRGWLTGMNAIYLLDKNAPFYSDKYFGFQLAYDKSGAIPSGTSFTVPQFGGNISGMIWKSKGDDVRRKYDFSFDNADRLVKANFIQNTDPNGSSWSTQDGNFSVHGFDTDNSKIRYDLNGNILKLVQHGIKPGSPDVIIDKLQYNYQTNSHKLQAVIDEQNDKDSKLGDFRYDPDLKTATDYAYDPNGNLVKDLNKQMTDDLLPGIEYNHLNLPIKVRFKNKGTIDFVYDAQSTKLQKIVTDESASGKKVVTTSTYIDGFVYESRITTPTNSPNDDYTDKLLFVTHEEGRIRFEPGAAGQPVKQVFDYMLADHLGSVRMVLTEENQQDIYPAATLEGNINNNNEAVALEKKFYSIDPANIVASTEATGITSYINKNGGSQATDPPVNNNPNSQVTANSSKLYRLTATGSAGVTGLGINLKVMAGDKIDVFGKSYYFQNNTGGNNFNIPVIDILSGILGAPGSDAVIKGVTPQQLQGQSAITNLVSNYLSDPNRGNGGSAQTPKAYINWTLFDENFKLVTGNFSRVGTANIVKDHNEPGLRNIDVTRNGYLYVYVSNESPVRVYFDNLQVVHTRGPILEENHYYPFGLTMAAISSKAANKVGNRFKFNGKEFGEKELADGSGLSWYDYGAREYDPQIARFFRIDPISDKLESLSPYQYASNDPITNIDLDGLAPASTSHIWRSAGFSSRGGVTYFNPNSDLGRYYNRRQAILDAATGAIWLGSIFIEGAGLVARGGGAVIRGSAQIARTATARHNALGVAAVRRLQIQAIEAGKMEAITASLGRLSLNDGARFGNFGKMKLMDLPNLSAANNYLKGLGMPIKDRLNIFKTFDMETISLKVADNKTYGLRFYGGEAKAKGSYLFPSFTNYTNRKGLALLPKWNNTMQELAQFKIEPGTPYLFGRASTQRGPYVGGSHQMFLPWQTSSNMTNAQQVVDNFFKSAWKK